MYINVNNKPSFNAILAFFGFFYPSKFPTYEALPEPIPNEQ